MEAILLHPQVIAILSPLAKLFVQQCIAWAIRAFNERDHATANAHLYEEFKKHKDSFRKTSLSVLSSASGAWLGFLTVAGPVGIIGGGLIGGALGIHYALTNRSLDQTIKRIIKSTEMERVTILETTKVEELEGTRLRELEDELDVKKQEQQVGGKGAIKDSQLQEKKKVKDKLKSLVKSSEATKTMTSAFGVLNDVFAHSYQAQCHRDFESLDPFPGGGSLGVSISAIHLCSCAAAVVYEEDTLETHMKDPEGSPLSGGRKERAMLGEWRCLKVVGKDHFKVFFFESPRQAMIVFRGTQTLGEMLVNCNFIPSSGIDQEGGLKVHGGYKIVVDNVLEEVRQFVESQVLQRGKQLMMTGHSLGGGLATLALTQLLLQPPFTQPSNTSLSQEQVVCITFGAPQVLQLHHATPTTRVFTEGIEPRLVHVVHQYDVVPRLLCQLDKALDMVSKGLAKDLQLTSMNFCPVGRLVVLWKEKGLKGKVRLSSVPHEKKQMVLRLPDQCVTLLYYAYCDHYMDSYEANLAVLSLGYDNSPTSASTDFANSLGYSIIEKLI